MQRVRWRVSGRVQGVGFRFWVLRAARGLGLAGYVMNRADGSVEVEAEGPAAALEQLRHTVANGPDGAVVQNVEALEPGASPLPATFEIRR